MLKDWIKDEDQSWWSFFAEVFFLILFVLGIRFYVFQFFRVSGPSMCPTVNQINGSCEHETGEFIFANEFLYHFIRTPKRGEIVVLKPPNNTSFYIKRIVGVPGDTITVEDGKVYLTNDKHQKFELPEKYLSPRNQGRTFSEQEKMVVTPGNYLVFGDNRTESLDARHCFGSCYQDDRFLIPEKDVKGRAEFVIWPFWTMRWLDNNVLDVINSEQ